MHLRRNGWILSLILCFVALPASAAQNFNFQCRADRIASGPLGQTHVFRVPISAIAPGNDSVWVHFEAHLPEGWFSQWCQKQTGICFVDDQKIELAVGYSDTLLIDVLQTDTPGMAYIDLTVTGVDDELDIARCTYAYFCGQPIPNVKYAIDCSDSYRDYIGAPPYPISFEFRAPVRNTGTINDSLAVWIRSDVPQPGFAQFCLTSTGVCYQDNAVIPLPVGVLDTLRVDVFTFGEPGITHSDLEVHSASNPGLVNWCHFSTYAGGVPVSTPDPVAAAPLTLSRAVPNPFSESTTLRLETAGNEQGRLFIYGADGRVVRTYPPIILSPGGNSVRWDGRGDRGESVPSGVYFYRFQSTGEVLRGVLIRTK